MKTSAKQVAGTVAAELIKDDTIVGLGTGTTAECFIKALGERCRKGLKIQCVTSSEASYDLADDLEIPLIDAGMVDHLDIYVDGADEIDPKKNMIKGGGGALTREKILATMSSEMIVIVDSSKLVDKLGHFPLPIEIIPFAHLATLRHLEELGYTGTIRKNQKGSAFITENSNLIYDVQLQYLITNPAQDHARIKAIPGVVETGLFFNIAGRVIVGYEDGHVSTIP